MRDDEHRAISSATSLFSRKGPSSFILTLYNSTRDRPTIDSREFLDRDMMEESCEGKPEPISRRHHYHPRLVHGRSKLVAHVVLLSGRVLSAVFKLLLGESGGVFLIPPLSPITNGIFFSSIQYICGCFGWRYWLFNDARSEASPTLTLTRNGVTSSGTPAARRCHFPLSSTGVKDDNVPDRWNGAIDNELLTFPLAIALMDVRFDSRVHLL
jgi:hypothetical protein